MIDIVPAIDIMDGRCVRLSEGDYGRCRVYDAKPADMAMAFADCGVKRIHLVDLDGARTGAPANLRTLGEVASVVGLEIEWGGGVSSDGALSSVFSAGATQAIIGSVAVKRQDLMHGWLKAYGPDKIVLGADQRDGKVAVKGWIEDSELSVGQLLDKFLPDGLNQAVVTDISRDGMLSGPSFDLYRDLAERYPSVIFTVSGGISGFGDIERLDAMGLRRVIVGKAIYEGRISMKEIQRWSQNA